jgi:dihydroorotase
MNIIIRNAKIIDSYSLHNNKVVDILIKNGKIEQIAKNINAPANTKELKSKNIHVSPGWLDMQAQFCEPGFEYKEDLETGTKAAAKGGFTAVALLPNTIPVCDNKASVEYLKKYSKNNAVDIIPIGSISEGLKGENISEMYDMHLAGAAAFCNAKKSANTGLLTRALLYAKPFGSTIMDFPLSKDIAANGNVNEGVAATKLGLKGIPSVAEDLIVNRDIYLAEYCDSALHFTQVSSANALQLIKNAKNKSLKITCGLSTYHLMLSDENLATFDSNYKVSPPLKTQKEIKLFIKAIKENVVDVLISDHTPQHIENKRCEFDLAAYGIINLQTSFSIANTILKNEIPIKHLVDLFCNNPRKLLKKEIPLIKEGEDANITVFDPNEEWIFTEENIVSKSKNTPFIGKKFIGKVLGIYNNKQWIEN